CFVVGHPDLVADFELVESLDVRADSEGVFVAIFGTERYGAGGLVDRPDSDSCRHLVLLGDRLVAFTLGLGLSARGDRRGGEKCREHERSEYRHYRLLMWDQPPRRARLVPGAIRPSTLRIMPSPIVGPEISDAPPAELEIATTDRCRLHTR